jgi:hypothetical protein
MYVFFVPNRKAQESSSSSKMSKDRTASKPATGIPVRTSTAARALLFPTPVSGSVVASPKTAPRENVDKGAADESSSSDDDAVLDECIKVAWMKSEEEAGKQVRGANTLF